MAVLGSCLSNQQESLGSPAVACRNHTVRLAASTLSAGDCQDRHEVVDVRTRWIERAVTDVFLGLRLVEWPPFLAFRSEGGTPTLVEGLQHMSVMLVLIAELGPQSKCFCARATRSKCEPRLSGAIEAVPAGPLPCLEHNINRHVHRHTAVDSR